MMFRNNFLTCNCISHFVCVKRICMHAHILMFEFVKFYRIFIPHWNESLCWNAITQSEGVTGYWCIYVSGWKKTRRPNTSVYCSHTKWRTKNTEYQATGHEDGALRDEPRLFSQLWLNLSDAHSASASLCDGLYLLFSDGSIGWLLFMNLFTAHQSRWPCIDP